TADWKRTGGRGRCNLKWFSDLKIGTKLLAGFFAVALIAGLIGGVGLSGINELNASAATTYTEQLVPIRDLGYANAAFLIARTEIRSMMGTKDRSKRAEFVSTIDAETRKTEAYIATYSKTSMVKEEQETLPKFQA